MAGYCPTNLSAIRHKERVWRGNDLNDELNRRDIIIQEVKTRYKEITKYKQVRSKSTSCYISEAEWREIKDVFPQCCKLNNCKSFFVQEWVDFVMLLLSEKWRIVQLSTVHSLEHRKMCCGFWNIFCLFKEKLKGQLPFWGFWAKGKWDNP